MRTVAGVLLLWAFIAAALAQDNAPGEPRFVADIELQTSAEFVELLQRASQLLVDGAVPQDGVARVSLVLHGPVIRDLLRQNYSENRELVNLAASLTALQVVEIKACQTWMASNEVNSADLQPFVETVSFAPRELRRLIEEKNYLDF